ncbi:hypothetical protein [Novosphingobium huizhouense]|uniref:hypothetical protein n=1 Tax=Novosphingobium huizhouense TaxID=2866625 RepID=UPI001CD81DC0|nr:hypothetical protein [Novosphingobium huizhouense]
MRGEISTGRQAKRHPYDWYVEQGWEWEQIVAAIGLEEAETGTMIWDPAAGFGHSASRLQGMGFAGSLLLSDIVNRVAWDDFERPEDVTFTSACFIEDGPWEVLHGRVSIWCNPPFSYRHYWLDGRKMIVSEAFVRRALQIATDRVVMILPAKWLAMGKRRSRLVRVDHPPQFVLHFCERPSMPPGDMIEAMGGRAYRGGMVDYCAVVWDVRNPTAPGDTRTIWLPPLGLVEERA